MSKYLLANEFSVLYESPGPVHIYAYTPAITRLPSGRLVASTARTCWCCRAHDGNLITLHTVHGFRDLVYI